jgi:vancomycin resistance protein YoaR
MRSGLTRPPQDAVFHPASHTRTRERAGRELDVEASLLRLSVAEPARIPYDALVFSAVEPKLRLSDFPDVDVTQVAGSYETDFKGKAGARAVNIRRAAQLMDGLILPPGARFSFNRSVGKREKERGFVEAPVIVNDELESGLGGGVCQAATTLHAAARFAGLTIVERRSHSRASGYAPLGLDATVIDGKVDLRFENPFDEALMIHAYLPTPTTVRVEILGRAGSSRVEHRYQVLERQPFQRRLVEKTELAPGSFERKQKGSYGYNIVSVLTLTDVTGHVHTTRYPSKYYPVPEVFAVGPGTELSALPELPPGAIGLEDPAPDLIR